MNDHNEYWFMLFVEYMSLWHQWIKWYEDYWDMFFIKKLEED